MTLRTRRKPDNGQRAPGEMKTKRTIQGITKCNGYGGQESLMNNFTFFVFKNGMYITGIALVLKKV